MSIQHGSKDDHRPEGKIARRKLSLLPLAQEFGNVNTADVDAPLVGKFDVKSRSVAFRSGAVVCATS